MTTYFGIEIWYLNQATNTYTSLVQFTPTSNNPQGHLVEYTPQAADINAESIVDSAIVDLIVPSASSIDYTLGLLNFSFDRANEYYEQGVGDPIYLILLLNQDPAASPKQGWRSLIHKGSTQIESATWMKGEWANNTRRVVLTWERDPFWESLEPDPVLMTNTHHASGVATATIENTYDGSTTDNRVKIDATEITGDIPCPVIVNIKMKSASNVCVDTMLVARHIRPGDTVRSHFWEAESMAFGASGADETVAGRSGGHVVHYTGVAAGSWESLVTTTLQAIDVNLEGGGKPYKILAAIKPTTLQGYYFQAYVIDQGGNFIYGSTIYKDWSTASANYQLVDLGTILVPKVNQQQGGTWSTAGTRFGIRVKPVTSTAEYRIDFVEAIAVNYYASAWGMSTAGLGQNDLVEYDAQNNAFAIETTPSNLLFNSFRAGGSGIYLYPKRDNYIYLNSAIVASGETVHHLNTYEIKIYQIIRRRTV